MNKNRKAIIKITLGAIFAALSIAIKILIDPIFGRTFGTPFYGIPLILSGIYLGPVYALIVGIVADTTSGIIKGDYMALFVFSSIAWAVIPSLFTRKPRGLKWFLIIYLTYIIATSFNTLALYVHLGPDSARVNLYLRMGLIPIFGFVMAVTTQVLFNRLSEVLPVTLRQEKPNNT